MSRVRSTLQIPATRVCKKGGRYCKKWEAILGPGPRMAQGGIKTKPISCVSSTFLDLESMTDFEAASRACMAHRRLGYWPVGCKRASRT